ncbi:MAG: LysM peptidoglycan-binding domain-containing protein [Elusimicrobia bacterium]|nr:LysM peptidoglycan-binding domain-containing protein [Elusimicrobiota bacterium]
MRRLVCAVLAGALFALDSAGTAADLAAEKKFQNVTVKPGDTLWGISHTWLKDPAKWDEILKHNRLPSSDPTVALPGMTLQVPITLIKEEMRAATLFYRVNRVEFRRQDTAQWKSAAEEMQLLRGDSLHTFDDSKAKVRFVNKQVLSLDPNSMAIIKPVAKDYDVELKGGGVFVGHSRVVTASARITPKTMDTEYSAKVRQDLSTLVEVYKGAADVDAQGKTVEVPAGMSTEVQLGMSPGVPKLVADLPVFEARAADFRGETMPGRSRIQVGAGVSLAAQATAEDINASGDMEALGADMKTLSIGQPVSGYHVQASRNRDFATMVFDKTYSLDENIRLGDENIPPGVYWWRVAIIDLLGAELPFSAPRLYSVGVTRAVGQAMATHTSFRLLRPAADETVFEDTYRVTGIVNAENLTVLVDGKPVRSDESGNFLATVKLKPGPNVIRVQVSDVLGQSKTVTRRVTYTPPAKKTDDIPMPPSLP